MKCLVTRLAVSVDNENLDIFGDKYSKENMFDGFYHRDWHSVVTGATAQPLMYVEIQNVKQGDIITFDTIEPLIGSGAAVVVYKDTNGDFSNKFLGKKPDETPERYKGLFVMPCDAEFVYITLPKVDGSFFVYTKK